MWDQSSLELSRSTPASGKELGAAGVRELCAPGKGLQFCIPSELSGQFSRMAHKGFVMVV